ncbi:hypothetical protein EYF80_023734 [Liparis tanakae]|uniref:Uncharacterized protein n=1 Tax=Liparis tanakae TaxID=230148 RepID=A0A4Z2HJJ0_9TELE|nr:hypothetical protein EYF80_023734 [Liparis tanakae]
MNVRAFGLEYRAHGAISGAGAGRDAERRSVFVQPMKKKKKKKKRRPSVRSVCGRRNTWHRAAEAGRSTVGCTAGEGRAEPASRIGETRNSVDQETALIR